MSVPIPRGQTNSLERKRFEEGAAAGRLRSCGGREAGGGCTGKGIGAACLGDSLSAWNGLDRVGWPRCPGSRTVVPPGITWRERGDVISAFLRLLPQLASPFMAPRICGPHPIPSTVMSEAAIRVVTEAGLVWGRGAVVHIGEEM